LGLHDAILLKPIRTLMGYRQGTGFGRQLPRIFAVAGILVTKETIVTVGQRFKLPVRLVVRARKMKEQLEIFGRRADWQPPAGAVFK
jgi:hypothetical protein